MSAASLLNALLRSWPVGDEESLSKAKSLLEAGANPNEAGCPSAAVLSQDLRLVELMMGFGMRMRDRGSVCGDSAFASAAGWADLEYLRDLWALMERFGLTEEELKGGSYPLCEAAEERTDGFVETARFLMEKGFELDRLNSGGMGALHYAASKSAERTKEVLSLGADPNASVRRGTAPLHGAAFQGSLETVRALIEAGADLDAEDASMSISGFGMRPLDSALSEGNGAVAELLIEAGADIDGNVFSRIAYAAVEANAEGALMAAFKRGASPDSCVRLSDGRLEPMGFAALEDEGRDGALSAMAAFGMDVEATDGLGRTLLQVAVESNLPICVGILVRAGADLKKVGNTTENEAGLVVKMAEIGESVRSAKGVGDSVEESVRVVRTKI